MNVKPKDLAMVVNTNHPDWDGATCTVIAASTLDSAEIEKVVRVAGPYWLVEMARPMLIFSLSIQAERMGRQAYLPDSLLRKIGGPDVDTRSFDEVVAGHVLEAQS